LFVEGCEKGYFVKNSAGEPYLIKSVSIKFAMIDFTNPEAKQWCKHIIKDHLIKEARAGGWMHDFGEYMPFDAVLSDGSDPIMYHNKYVEEWARCGAEAVSEVENGKDLFYFMRAATTFSPRYTSLFWMGD
jgi:alpha-glucosidase